MIPPQTPPHASMQTISAKNHGVNENVEKKNATRKKSRSRSARVSAALRAIAIADVEKNGIKKI